MRTELRTRVGGVDRNDGLAGVLQRGMDLLLKFECADHAEVGIAS